MQQEFLMLANTSLARAARKNLWHGPVLFIAPNDFCYQITTLAPRVLFFWPCDRFFIAQCCLVKIAEHSPHSFLFFMDLDKLELTWPIHSGHVYFRLSL